MRKLRISPDGKCRKCGNGHWTVYVVHSESSVDADASAVGLGLLAVAGMGLSRMITETNHAEYPHVTADVIAWFNEFPRFRMQRIAEFATAKERQRLQAQGARECLACDSLFVPTANKRWNDLGYCSKMCAVEVEGVEAVVETSAPFATNTSSANAMSVECPRGHRFEVGVSFRGLRRPCPMCGTKTIVPLS